MAHGLFERGARLFQTIAGNGQGNGLTAGLTHGRGQRIGVGVHNLTRLQRHIGFGQFIARTQNGDSGMLMHQHKAASDRGQQPDIRGTQDPARLENRLAGLDVLTARADIIALGTGLANKHPVGLFPGVFDLDDGIGPRRQDGAGHDFTGRPGCDRFGWHAAGLNDFQDGQRNGLIGLGGLNVVMPHRIAIHGGVGKRRDFADGLDILSQDAPGCFKQTDPLTGQRRDGLQNLGQGLMDGDHTHTLRNGWATTGGCPYSAPALTRSCKRRSLSRVFSTSSALKARNRSSRPALLVARICMASRPALRAPSMATVATGTPAGI